MEPTSRIKIAPTKLVYISGTADPLETLYAVWVTSRPTEHKSLLDWIESRYGSRLPTASHIKTALAEGFLQEEQVNKVFTDVIAMSIPVSECIHFTWGLENVPLTWREQAVRERNWGFWLTSMREFDLSTFVEDGRVNFPARFADQPYQQSVSTGWEDSHFPELVGEEIVEQTAAGALAEFFQIAEKTYNVLIQKGMTQEEARECIPLAIKHNGTMFSNLRTLQQTVSKRSCWVAQADLWGPIITEMMESLRGVHVLLGALSTPPCFKALDDKYQGCKFVRIMDNRMHGSDPYAVCPIYLKYATTYTWESHLKELENNGRGSYANLARRHLPMYGKMWHRDPHTGACVK